MSSRRRREEEKEKEDGVPQENKNPNRTIWGTMHEQQEEERRRTNGEMWYHLRSDVM